MLTDQQWDFITPSLPELVRRTSVEDGRGGENPAACHRGQRHQGPRTRTKDDMPKRSRLTLAPQNASDANLRAVASNSGRCASINSNSPIPNATLTAKSRMWIALSESSAAIVAESSQHRRILDPALTTTWDLRPALPFSMGEIRWRCEARQLKSGRPRATAHPRCLREVYQEL